MLAERPTERRGKMRTIKLKIKTTCDSEHGCIRVRLEGLRYEASAWRLYCLLDTEGVGHYSDFAANDNVLVHRRVWAFIDYSQAKEFRDLAKRKFRQLLTEIRSHRKFEAYKTGTETVPAQA